MQNLQGWLPRIPRLLFDLILLAREGVPLAASGEVASDVQENP
jgi:hypothetical protein